MTNETKQTAVDWLISKLQNTRDWQRVINEVNQSSSAVKDVVEQAKKMEKEQAILFAWECQEMFKHEIKEHYEQTYGGNK